MLGGSSEQKKGAVEPLSEETTVKIMRELAAEVQKIALTLSKKEEAMRRKAAQHQQQIDENVLKDLLAGEIHKGVELARNQIYAKYALENQIYAKYEVVEAQVQLSCLETHKDNPSVRKATEDIKAVLAIGAEPDLSDFTIEKTIAVMETMMEGMTVALEECCAAVKAKMGAVNTQAAQKEINRLYVSRLEPLQSEVNNKHKCDKATLEAALMKYQMEPKLQLKMQELSINQQQRMYACGVQLGGQ